MLCFEKKCLKYIFRLSSNKLLTYLIFKEVLKIKFFTDLMLLVGTNPLPNYVVSKHLLKQNSGLKHLWLIHSEERGEIGQAGTNKYAESIKKVLKSEFAERDLFFEMIALSEVSSAENIVNDLEKKLVNKIGDRDFAIHLNYTGGTKSMAVHVYRYLEYNFKNNITFSYLDGRRYRLLWDNNKNIGEDLRNEVSLSLSNLIELHNYESLKEGGPLPQDYYPVLERFENLINSDGLTGYLLWKNKQIRGKYYSAKGFIKSTNKFLKHNELVKNNQNKKQLDQERINKFKQSFKSETPRLIHDLLLALPRKSSILDNEGNLWIPDSTITKALFEKRLTFTISDFLDGKWLEHYVYMVIKREIKKDNFLKNSFPGELLVLTATGKLKNLGRKKNLK